MKKILLLLFTSVLFMACEKPGSVDTEVPACIKKMITELEKEEVRNPPASIWQLEYNGQTVYYVPPYCCDMYGTIYDSDCQVVCHPDGGITGKGDGKCKNFSTNTKKVKLIWEDHR